MTEVAAEPDTEPADARFAVVRRIRGDVAGNPYCEDCVRGARRAPAVQAGRWSGTFDAPLDWPRPE